MNLRTVFALATVVFSFSAHAGEFDSIRLLQSLKEGINSGNILIDFPVEHAAEFKAAVTNYDLMSVERVLQLEKSATDASEQITFLDIKTERDSDQFELSEVHAIKGCLVRISSLSEASLCGMMEYRGTTKTYSVKLRKTVTGKIQIYLTRKVGVQG